MSLRWMGKQLDSERHCREQYRGNW